MKITRPLEDLGYAATHYIFSNATLALQKDEEQSIAIGILAWQRLSLLEEQMRPYGAKLPFLSTWIPCGLAALSTLPLPKATQYPDQHPQQATLRTKLKNLGSLIIPHIRHVSYTILQNTDKVLNIACAVNAIALIALGCPVSGAIAFFGLFILALKRQRLLPALFERYMDPLTIVGSLATTIATPMNLVRKTINLICYFPALSSFLTKAFEGRLPYQCTNPFYKKHILLPLPEDQEFVLANSARKEAFYTNPTHVYSDEIGRFLPTELDQMLDKLDAKALFDQLSAKIGALSEEEQTGLNNIRVCALTGRVADAAPSDIALFQKIIKALVQSILQDEENFAVRAKELANVGNSCVEGWTRDITALLSPQTHEAPWAVHHVLAKRRGEIVKEHIAQDTKMASILKTLGGTNDIHTTNAIQGALWHRLRTFEGELDAQLNKMSVINRLFFRYVLLRDPLKVLSPPSAIETIVMNSILTSIQPGFFTSAFTLGPILQRLTVRITEDSMDSEGIVEAVYSAIKPEYAPSPDGRIDRVEAKRTIVWQAIQTWMADILERRNIHLCDPETYEYDPRWVETDIAGEHFLSKAGVRLLLWDLGILVPSF